MKIFDCNGGKELPKPTLKLISALLQTQSEKKFSVEFVDVQMQEGSHDCGLFALVSFVMDKIQQFYCISIF